MMMKRQMGRKGFSLIEALLVMIVIAIAFFGFGFLYGNITQQALTVDLTLVATKLAREKLDQTIQLKADSGYSAVTTQASEAVTSGSYSFTRRVEVDYLSPDDFSAAAYDTSYKRVRVVVSWGEAAGESVTLTTMVTNMIPSAVPSLGFTQCS